MKTLGDRLGESPILGRRREYYISVLVGIIALIFCIDPGLGAEKQTAPRSGVDTIAWGVVSPKPEEKIVEHYRGFVDYVARKLSLASHVAGRVVVARGMLHLAKLINEKKVDFYMESPYPTYVINKETGARLLLRRWKGEVSDYRSVFFARRDSGITRIEDLLGKIIAFEDRGSTSGYFLPKVFLFRRGFRLTEKSSLQADVASKEIGYIFASSEKKIVSWVLERKVGAGAFSNLDFDKLDEKKKAELGIFAETEMFPRHFLSYRKNVDPALVKRLKDILLSMDKDDEGRKVLLKIDHTTKFDLLPGGERVLRKKMIDIFRPSV